MMCLTEVGNTQQANFEHMNDEITQSAQSLEQKAYPLSLSVTLGFVEPRKKRMDLLKVLHLSVTV